MIPTEPGFYWAQVNNEEKEWQPAQIEKYDWDNGRLVVWLFGYEYALDPCESVLAWGEKLEKG